MKQMAQSVYLIHTSYWINQLKKSDYYCRYFLTKMCLGQPKLIRFRSDESLFHNFVYLTAYKYVAWSRNCDGECVISMGKPPITTLRTFTRTFDFIIPCWCCCNPSCWHGMEFQNEGFLESNFFFIKRE